MENRDSGTPRAAGSSQASALTSITTLGGKGPWPSPPGQLGKAGQAFLEEPLAPFGHDLPGKVEPGADLFIGHPLGCV